MQSEELAADLLSGGMMGQGYQCGMLWGAALGAGAQAYRLFGASSQAETMAIGAAQKIVATFRAQNKDIDCSDITGIDLAAPTTRMMWRFLIRTGPKGSCFGMAASYAKAVFRDINATLAEKQIEASAYPISCASMLAKKMSASDLHAVMAAGFAGGIGLSGDACGALGAAIWINAMNSGKLEKGLLAYKNPVALATIDRYLKSADHEFECAKIVGRKFENVADHASFVRGGGCAKIIEALASPG